MNTLRNELRYLVLLSGEYPATTGDYSFIRHEIDALAGSFDQVLIYSFRAVEEPLAPLPENVSYMGALSASSRSKSFTAMLDWGRLGSILGSFRRERSSGRMKGHAALVLANILTGARFSAEISSDLRKKGATSGSRVSVYSFWGSHGALALPYLPKRYRKVVRLHRFDLYEGAGGRLPLRASIFGAADVLAPISEDGQRYLEENFGQLIAPGKIEVLRLGTEDHGVGPVPKPLSLRNESEPVRVVSCSSVIEVKRVSAILSALELISTQRSVHWTHFGSGKLMAELEGEVETAVINSPQLAVDLRGQAPNDEVISLYRTQPVDVFVNVSDSEGVPVSIMEALSFGIPAVATDAGGTGELVSKAAGAGILLPLRPSNDVLATSILEIAAGREHTRARRVWEQLSDARIASRRIVDVLKGDPAV